MAAKKQVEDDVKSKRGSLEIRDVLELSRVVVTKNSGEQSFSSPHGLEAKPPPHETPRPCVTKQESSDSSLCDPPGFVARSLECTRTF